MLDKAPHTLGEIENIVATKRRENPMMGDTIVASIYSRAESIAQDVVQVSSKGKGQWDKKIDDVITSRLFGYPLMLVLLGVVFWISIEGAEIPSEFLGKLLFSLGDRISDVFVAFNAPDWLHSILILGVYRTLAWVIAVMLPPMAIFFPLFTLLEDLGYLPRVAFNLDNLFRKAGAHGKQALTMCMGFGCNAAGVIACRIIDAPRERLIATITNTFVPCNGRFGLLIAMSTIFIAATVATPYTSIVATISVVSVILIGIMTTLIVSKLLSKTILKGIPSSFTLELPPYRKPQLGKVLVRSLLDRTLFVLGRAILVAAPAGLIIWIFANITIGDASILNHSAAFLDPFARLMGLDGFILMAFILGLPANEIVLPIVIMSYMAKGVMLELDSLEALRTLLVTNGWTWLTGINFMLFSLLHFPCGTVLLTIKKETQSNKWTWLSFAIPTGVAIIVTMGINFLVRGMGWI